MTAGDHMHILWLGVLGAMVVSAIAPGWIKAIVFVAALMFSGLLVRLPVHPHGHLHLTFAPRVYPTLIALAAVGFGIWSWHSARKRGLKHLGDAELRDRWSRVRGISKWGW